MREPPIIISDCENSEEMGRLSETITILCQQSDLEPSKVILSVSAALGALLGKVIKDYRHIDGVSREMMKTVAENAYMNFLMKDQEEAER